MIAYLRERFSGRVAAVGVAWVATIAIASLLTYVLCMQHPSATSDKYDAEVRQVIEQYIDALNAGDLKRLESLSTGIAEEHLNPSFKGGYVQDMASEMLDHGPMHIVDFGILARGDLVYNAFVYTEFEDQKNAKPENIYYYTGARVRYSMYRLNGQWKVMSVETFRADAK
ncbi:Uncharacterised protein [Mycobacteroides abscessus subsp. bolletii]|uniref:nuclear transport factor 2 family protein n=1 Tax=Mycobacteroides abscessus TaxID=36809 RepID=UPI0009A58CDC|nr:nuclear transport factor 2 family protein [Mycobacteroides abscessus]SLF46684.1 Uncharacterised protein [Mycobacteroides abscessus subsp. bolletii]